jgi:hypothetical protein
MPAWAPRVSKDRIRQLYETDAQGIYDRALIDEVGYALLARCESFIAAVRAVAGEVACPRCGACGWELAWGAYFSTIQHKQLSGAEPVLSLFREYVAAYPGARTSRERMLLIDRLLHGFHWYYKDNTPTRPVAINLIEGRLGDVLAFLADLTYGEHSTPGTVERFDLWDERAEVARGWSRDKET